MRTLSFTLLFVLALAGCMSGPAFRVVDADSGLPLERVQGERLEGHIEATKLPFVLNNALTPVEAKTSDASGTVAFEKGGSKYMFNPSRKNPAYASAYVTVGWTGATLVYPEESREIPLRKVNGVVEVPLRGFGVRSSDKPSSGSTLSDPRGAAVPLEGRGEGQHQ